MKKILICGNKFHVDIVCVNLNHVNTLKISRYYDLTKLNALRFLFLMLKSDEVLWIYPPVYSRLAFIVGIWLPNLLGKKISFLWIGSDVLALREILKSNFAQFVTPILKKIRHLCVSTWLKDELLHLGVESQEGPYLIFSSLFQKERIVREIFDTESLVVLSYIPQGERNFYGFDKILKLALAFPEVEFKLLKISKDDLLEESIPKNITCLGTVRREEMPFFYQQAHVFLRLTQHDGLPYSVLEALYYGLYVGFSYDYPFTCHITGWDSVMSFVRNLQYRFNEKTLVPNFAGRRFVKENFIDNGNYKENLLQVLNGDKEDKLLASQLCSKKL